MIRVQGEPPELRWVVARSALAGERLFDKNAAEGRILADSSGHSLCLPIKIATAAARGNGVEMTTVGPERRSVRLARGIPQREDGQFLGISCTKFRHGRRATERKTRTYQTPQR